MKSEGSDFQIRNADEILALTAEVYEGLSADQVDEIETMVHRREDFFGERKNGVNELY